MSSAFLGVGALLVSQIQAVNIGGVECRQGRISFADEVVAYNQNAGSALPSVAGSIAITIDVVHRAEKRAEGLKF